MNVTELARKLKINPAKLREIMPQLGFDIGEKAIKVDTKMAQAILEKLSNTKIRKEYLDEEVVSDFKKMKKVGEEKEKGDIIIEIPERIAVKELAKRMDMPVTNLILELMKNGVMASLNQEIDFETASIITEDLGFQIKKSDEEINGVKDVDYEKVLEIDKAKAIVRPPVVVVMGHVDHGKTKLLDAIRKTNIVDEESGGITQHIGAYQVEKDGRWLTFIDTPGHEAFSAMRSRGAKVADVAILIVAADDGVQPQTIEAIAHIKQAGLPFIVAINKIDKEDANVDKVKGDLAKIDLVPEDYGGKTICVPISAKQNLHIDKLLETLFLVVDMEEENIIANPEQSAVGTIIESHIDKGEGPIAAVLIQNGSLRINDLVKIGKVTGKIRAMRSWKGEAVKVATPSMPVKILGLNSAPQVGEILKVVANKKEFRKLGKISKVSQFHKKSIASKNNDNNEEDEKLQIKIILKTDVLGTTEAINESLEKINQDKVVISIVKQAMGNITEKDIENASGLEAYLIGFKVKMTNEAKKSASIKEVDVQLFDVIYDLIDFVKEEIKKIAGVERTAKKVGKFKILKIFRNGKKWQIAGGEILEGKVILNAKANILRNNEEIGEVDITEIESGKVQVKEVVSGQQAGIKVEGDTEVKEGDILEVYIIEEK